MPLDYCREDGEYRCCSLTDEDECECGHNILIDPESELPYIADAVLCDDYDGEYRGRTMIDEIPQVILDLTRFSCGSAPYRIRKLLPYFREEILHEIYLWIDRQDSLDTIRKQRAGGRNVDLILDVLYEIRKRGYA